MILLNEDEIEEDPKGRQNRRARMDRKQKDRKKHKSEKNKFIEESDDKYWREEIRKYEDR